MGGNWIGDVLDGSAEDPNLMAVECLAKLGVAAHLV